MIILKVLINNCSKRTAKYLENYGTIVFIQLKLVVDENLHTERFSVRPRDSSARY